MVENGPASVWMELWKEKRGILIPESDLNTYFTSGEINGKRISQLPLGKVSFPSGEMVVSDPYAPSEEWSPYFTKVASGDYETEASIVKTGGGHEYIAAIKVRFSDTEAVRYEEALIGDEDLEAADGDNFFGFGIESGAVCVCDAMCMRIFTSFKARYAEALGDRFAGLRESYFARRVEEGSVGSEKGAWGLAVNWTIPGTDYKMLIVDSASLEGYYPVYLGFDAEENLSALIVHLLSIESMDVLDDAAIESETPSGETTPDVESGDGAEAGAEGRTVDEPFFIVVDDMLETAESQDSESADADSENDSSADVEYSEAKDAKVEHVDADDADAKVIDADDADDAEDEHVSTEHVDDALDGGTPADAKQITFALDEDDATESVSIDSSSKSDESTADKQEEASDAKKGHLFKKIGRVFRK